jgi:hypothetical protein
MPDVLGRLRPPRLAGAPASPAVGELYYDTGTSILYWWNGTAWQSASGTTVAVETPHNIGAAGEPAFTNGWAAQSLRSAPGFYKDRSRGYLVGTLNGVSATLAAAFTLPVGYRPLLAFDTKMLYWNGSAYVVGVISFSALGVVSLSQLSSAALTGSSAQAIELQDVSWRL